MSTKLDSEKVREFYENFPYPNKCIESKEDLLKNAEWLAGLVGRKPKEFKKSEKILDAGCGTGEFSCAFALGKARVLGIDLSENSIEKAKKLALKFELENAEFEKADFMQASKLMLESFDFVFSMGALHHNKNPEECFKKLAKLVKPKGFLTVGLYNAYGRAPVKARRALLDLLSFRKSTEDRINFANRLFYNNKLITEQRRAWLADKFLHPLEKTVKLEEALDWFKKEGFQVVSSRPGIPKGKSLLFLQLKWMLEGESFFTLSGRKN